MIGVVVATHSALGAALLDAASGVCGMLENAVAVSGSAAESPEATLARLDEAVAKVEQGDGVIVLCDVFGGTPANLALALAQHRKVEVLCGVNLPMLLKLRLGRHAGLPLLELAQLLEAYGRSHIQLATELLRKRIAEP